MPIQNNIYYQSQSGGLCRLHSLNGYFGCEKISLHQFNIIQKKYDDEYKIKFNFESTCKNFDIVASDQKNIINYFLKNIGIYTRYYSMNQLYTKNLNQTFAEQKIIKALINNLHGDYFFIYNESHIWGCRRQMGKWFKVDSIGGVSHYNINSLLTEKNIGLIVPVGIKHEFYRNLKLIHNELGVSVKNTETTVKSMDTLTLQTTIKNYLIQKHKEKKILGELEIPLSICMDIFETNLLKKTNSMFSPIKTQVLQYNEFLSKFTKGNYNNITLILEFLPNILLELIKVAESSL
jgi:hypothetical protein